MTAQQRRLLWKALDRERESFKARWATAIRRRFEAEERAVQRALGRGTPAALRAISKTAWTSLYLDLWRDAAEQFGADVARQLGATIVGTQARKSFTLEDVADEDLPGWDYDPWSRHYQDAVNTIIGEKIVRVTDETRRAVAAAIQRHSRTDGPDTAAAAIKATYEGFSARRAYTIARTEGSAAAGYAAHHASMESGMVTSKTWLSSRDDRVRSSHRRLEGVKVDAEAMFPNGCMYACDPNGPAKEVINCRCVTTYGYDLPEDDEEKARWVVNILATRYLRGRDIKTSFKAARLEKLRGNAERHRLC